MVLTHSQAIVCDEKGVLPALGHLLWVGNHGCRSMEPQLLRQITGETLSGSHPAWSKPISLQVIWLASSHKVEPAHVCLIQ